MSDIRTLIDIHQKHGPSFMQLVFYKVAREAIPDGGGLGDAAIFFKGLAHGKSTIIRDSFEWALEAIEAVRSAPDNPYGNDEEIIACAIISKIKEAENA